MINVYATKEDYSKYGSKVLEDEEIEKDLIFSRKIYELLKI